jgi:uncharacterized protein YciI
MTEEQNPREHPQRNIPRNLKQYYLGLLTKGARWNKIDDQEAHDLLPKHLAFIRQQIEAKRYIVAGPVNEDAPYVGMMLIEAGSKEEALHLASADPGVKAERLALEVYPVLLPSLEAVQVRF